VQAESAQEGLLVHSHAWSLAGQYTGKRWPAVQQVQGGKEGQWEQEG
jgi:hypothetical protein